MLKKLLFAAVLLLLVSVQAMTVSCDLRCSLMGASTDCHVMEAVGQMPHCHGMSMGQDKQASVTASDSCAPADCQAELTAITKSVDQDDAVTGKLLVPALVLSVDLLGTRGPSRTTSFAALSQRSEARPFAQSPGSSLRI